MTQSIAIRVYTLTSTTVTGLSADSTGFGSAVRVGYCSLGYTYIYARTHTTHKDAHQYTYNKHKYPLAKGLRKLCSWSLRKNETCEACRWVAMGLVGSGLTVSRF